MLEQHDSHNIQESWRAKVRQQMKSVSGKPPLYLEAFLAAGWFADGFSARFLNLAQATNGKPFAEVLLEENESPGQTSYAVIGTRFEAAAGLLLSATPGFEVRSARETSDEQVDLVVLYAPDRLSRLSLPAGPGLVECKWRNDTNKGVSVSELRDFGAKCLFHRIDFGILITRSGVTGGGATRFEEPTHAELVHRRFLIDGLTILVLDVSHLRNKAFELRGLQDALVADHDRLVFGPIAGEKLSEN